MVDYVRAQPEYDVPARHIAGTSSEKLQQIDEAIQELLDIKLLECAQDQPNVRFLAVPRPRSHWFAMTMTIGILLIILVLLLGVHPAHAQDAPTATRWQAGAFLDVAYLGDLTSRSAQTFRSRGTTRVLNEFGIDMAAAYLRKTATAASRWGVELTAQGGRDSELFGFSPTAPNLSGADTLRHFGPTDVGYLAPVGHGLMIQGGIFNSLIGYDSLYAKDNFAYTRPWAADFTPYLMLGVNATYPLSDRVSLAGAVVNAYFHLSHPNDASSGVTQVSWSFAPDWSLKETFLFGSHQADTSPEFWRMLSDTILEQKGTRLTVAGELQFATERVAATNERATWAAVQLPARVLISGPWSAGVRPEIARDASGRYTGFRQNVFAVTSTLQFAHASGTRQTIARLEHRYDNSTGPDGGFFSTADSDPGAPLTHRQNLIVGALILTFDSRW